MRKLPILSVCFLFFLSLAGSIAHSRTLYVKQDGTGDYTTIREAMHRTLAGDTVLVGPGDYYEDYTIRMENGVVLTSESGPASTWISGFNSEIIRCWGLSSPLTEISGFHINQGWYGISLGNCTKTIIKRNVFSGNRDGLRGTDCTSLDIHTNVFLDNHGTGGGNGVGLVNSTATLHHNTFYLSNPEIQCLYGRGILAYSNIFWGTVVDFDLFEAGSICNDFYNIADAGQWAGQNFSADPELCGPTGGNYNLQSDSPCAPGNPPMDSCGRIGALPVGCQLVPSRKMTWGEIKAIYNE